MTNLAFNYLIKPKKQLSLNQVPTSKTDLTYLPARLYQRITSKEASAEGR